MRETRLSVVLIQMEKDRKVGGGINCTRQPLSVFPSACSRSNRQLVDSTVSQKYTWSNTKPQAGPRAWMRLEYRNWLWQSMRTKKNESCETVTCSTVRCYSDHYIVVLSTIWTCAVCLMFLALRHLCLQWTTNEILHEMGDKVLLASACYLFPMCLAGL